MGARGPLRARSPEREARLGKPGHRRPRSAPLTVAADGAKAASVPPSPSGMGRAGAELWRQAWTGRPWLRPDRDQALVAHLVELELERAEHRRVLEAEGWVLREAIADPRGGVLAERVVPHPRAAMLRACERALAEVRKALAATPTAAARLGVQLVQGERQLTLLQEMQGRAADREARALPRRPAR